MEHVKGSFGNLAESFRQNPNFLIQSPKIFIEKLILHQKIVFLTSL